MDKFDRLENAVETLDSPVRLFGTVTGVSGLLVSACGLDKTVMGHQCDIEDAHGEFHAAEIVGYKNGDILLMPFGTVEGIGPGCKVYAVRPRPEVRVSFGMVGRVMNALGEPIDGRGAVPLLDAVWCPLKAKAPSPGRRKPVGAKLDVGVRAINTFVPICMGQRMGIFAGSGVGKSVLMSMVAKYSAADINVIGLVGERGREVREFIDEQLGEEGLKRSVVIVATGDEPPLMRRQAAYLTLAVAEYFRDCGKSVMLFMDSVTRFALAQREIGLSAGEPPTTRGFTPSVFSELPRLLERAGPGEGEGSITGIFTVLVEGGDMDEPVADAVRGIVDGHMVLTRDLAEKGHFPAIDVLKSVSRMVPQCNTAEENAVVTEARRTLSTYTNMEELIRLGAYKTGTDANVDKAVHLFPALEQFLRQAPAEYSGMAEAYEVLGGIVKGV